MTINLAQTHQRSGDPDNALVYLGQATEPTRQCNNTTAQATALDIRSQALTDLGNHRAVAELARAGAEQAVPLTGGGNGIAAPAVAPLPGLPELHTDRDTYLYLLAATALILAATAALAGSRFGLVTAGIADHEPRMRANGHHVAAHLWTVHLAAAGIAGAAGALLVAAHRHLAPTDLGFDTSALALLAAIIGGRSLATTGLAAAGIIAARDLAAIHLPGSAPVLLGALFLAAALARSPTVRRRLPHRVRR